ncbi:MAG: non-canonical purine NTP pyrophosphatase [Planctomycetes bacterium]|nr:non-canonical purine NTP pyrophosphatase [Planctomycetota bacterium]
MPTNPVNIVVGTNNRHKLREIRQIMSDVQGVELVGLSAYTGVPEVVEDADTFAGNAQKKAFELARFIALAGRVGFASQSTSMDDEDETDFEALSAKRHRSASGRQRRVSLTPERVPKVDRPRNLDLLIMADDSGLEVDALDGAPGVKSARYAGTHGDDTANNRLLLSNLKGVPAEKRKARFVCEIALASPEGILFTVRGTVEGLIIDEQRGEGGFGYDPLFFYPPLNKTFGEIPPEEKNKISHRSKALAKFHDELAKLLASR